MSYRSTKRGKAVEPESKGDEASSSSDEGEKERTEDQEPSGSGPASKQKKGKAAQGGELLAICLACSKQTEDGQVSSRWSAFCRSSLAVAAASSWHHLGWAE